MKKRKILFAHQSTIPFYRVEFYNTLNKLMPDNYEFEVVFDKEESQRFFFTATEESKFNFKVLKTKTFNLKLFNRTIQFQNFPSKLSKYDMIVVGTTTRNLSYLLVFISKLFGKKIGLLGKGRDYEQKHNDWLNSITENLKILLAKRSSAFFAYTQSVKDYLVSRNVNPQKIFVINNTIDITKNRNSYNKLILQRDELRSQNNLQNKKVLLYVGRLIKNKNINFLLQAFNQLIKISVDYRLVLIGSGEESIIKEILNSENGKYIDYKGYIPEEEIGSYYVISDLYIYPGTIGLGPLQAICYNLIPAVIDSKKHSAEYEYLNDNNSLIFPDGTDADTYAQKIDEFINSSEKFNELRRNAFNSIQHLTLENMARNFIKGIEYSLRKKGI